MHVLLSIPVCLLARDVHRDSDLWANYTRACVGHTLEITAKAALNEDEDLESLLPGHTQPARPAPKRQRA